MGFFSRLFNQPKKDSLASGLPANWKKSLLKSNFFMAQRGIAYVLHVANQQAEGENGQFMWKKEIVDRWEQFALNPCFETAVPFVTVMPDLLPYFDRTFQQSQYPAIWTALTFCFEHYVLPEKTSDIKELRELSPQEYAVITRQFKGETIYHATPINFLGRQWEFMVSSVRNKNYKWASSLVVGENEDFGSICDKVVQYCVRWLGATTDERQGYLFWDTSDGNVILQLAKMNDLSDISIFITSREIRSLEQL